MHAVKMPLIRAMLIFSLCFVANFALAGTATFTWVKPNPAFDSVVPADWIIDEYRLKCTAMVAGQPDVSYTRVIAGYDTQTATFNDLPNGDTSCFMTSYSVKAGAESIPSQTVTKFVFDAPNVNPPTIFDFIPQVAGAAIQGDKPSYTSRTIVTADGLKTRVNCSFKRSVRGNAVSVCKATTL